MSNFPSASEPTSPGLPVRSSEAFGAFQDASPATPSAESEEITPTASGNGPHTFIVQERDDEIRQEEVSRSSVGRIISQDYEGSNANTPRIPPAIWGNHDLDQLPADQQTMLEPSSSLNKSNETINSELNPSYSHISQDISSINTQLKSSMLIKQASSDKLKSSPKTLLRDNTELKLHSTTHSDSLHSQPLYDPRKQPYPLGRDSKLTQTASSSSDSLSSETLDPKTESKISSRRAREEAFAEQRRRSTSRSSQGRVEKSIEATLAEEAPISNARSRKSSHMLGLFRENTAPIETRRTSQNAKAIHDTSGDGKWNKSNEIVGSGNSCRQFNARSMTEPQDKRTDNESTASVCNSKMTRRESSRKSLSDELRSEITWARSVLNSSCNDSAAEERVPQETAKNTSQPKSSDRSSRKRLPSRLLEEIREHHNLDTPFHDKFRTSQTKSTGQQPILKTKGAADELHSSKFQSSTECKVVNSHKTSEEQETEDDDDSDKEQISSALYFPHQAPSPDALQDMNINEARAKKEAAQDDGQLLPEAALSPGDEPGNDSGDVDINLQSRNRSRHLHGDLQQARPPVTTDHDLANLMSDIASSASESETESLDYSSQTDNAEITPKASPASKGSYFQIRGRKARPTTPLGAVELKPYNHQVGGHTTVFRFSKRAVCKQLTSRENRFYELVEKHHPELLKFLPKSVRP